MSTAAAQTIIAADAVFMVLSAVAVILRFYARKRNSAPLLADDWLVVVAWCFAAGLAITNIIGVPIGSFGSLFETLDNNDTIAFLKILFAIQFFYVFAVAFVKLSVLYFYKRIFTIDKTPVVIWIFIALTIGWLISFFFATLFQIYPIECNWVICPETTNFPLIYVMESATDIVLDVAILCMPAFFIRHLHEDLKKKLGIAGIFGLGIFCVFASIARLKYTIDYMRLYVNADFATAFGEPTDNMILWSGIEACVSTACACLPCYGSLMRKRKRSSTPRTWRNLSDGSSGAFAASTYARSASPLDALEVLGGEPAAFSVDRADRIPSISMEEIGLGMGHTEAIVMPTEFLSKPERVVAPTSYHMR